MLDEDAHHPALLIQVTFPVFGKSCCNVAPNPATYDYDFFERICTLTSELLSLLDLFVQKKGGGVRVSLNGFLRRQ